MNDNSTLCEIECMLLLCFSFTDVVGVNVRCRKSLVLFVFSNINVQIKNMIDCLCMKMSIVIEMHIIHGVSTRTLRTIRDIEVTVGRFTCVRLYCKYVRT